MAWTLSEMSKIETDILRKSIVDTLIMETKVLELLPLETIGQLSTGIIKVQDLPSVGFRRINAGYAESTGTFEHEVEQIALLGGYIDTDKAIARAKNTVADARSVQQMLMMKAMAYKFNDVFMNGDPAQIPTEEPKGHEFKGLRLRVEDLVSKGYTGQRIAHEEDVDDEAKRYAFVDKLDELIYSVAGHQPDALLMSKKTLLGVRSILRRLKLLDTTQDMFDRRVDVYQGARMYDMGVKADQSTQVILDTEHATDAKADGADRSSIYAVKFGVGDMLWGIQEYPIEVEDLGLMKEKPVYRTMVDFPVGLAQVDPRCMARLWGFKLTF